MQNKAASSVHLRTTFHRVLVCGGRDFNDRRAVTAALDELARQHLELVVIQGGASGADLIAREWAMSRCHAWITFPADWDAHGKAAGPIRNQKMVDEGQPNVVLAFPGGKGTADMVRRARAAGITIQHMVKVERSDPPADWHWRRFGPGFAKPCADGSVVECAMPECQLADRCRKETAPRSARP